MDVTPKTLDAFRESLAERGLSEGTQRLYVVLLHACAQHPSGLTARLLDDRLAAKSRRTNRAALLAWCDFSDDEKLAKRVRRIKLPPAVRKKPKIPFEVEQWRRLAREIRTDKDLAKTPATRAALLLVSLRGLRMADALRTRRADVAAALRTGRFAFYAKGNRRLEYDAAPIKEPLQALHQIKAKWEIVEDLIVSERCKSTGYAKRQAAYVQLDRALRRIAKKVGIRDVHGHRFRRTYASSYLKALGHDPNALVKLTQHVGWTNIATAATYVDAVNREELDRVGDKMTKEIFG